MYRIGFGYDVHPLVKGRNLTLGGIRVEHSVGTLGHSDADVLLHAICDAMLGALALGDIGQHFPDQSEKYKDIDSKILLAETFNLINEKGWSVVNLDTSLCLEKPKIMPYIPEMQKIISAILKTTPQQVSVKATTNEKMGFVGREEGVAAYAVVLLEKH